MVYNINLFATTTKGRAAKLVLGIITAIVIGFLSSTHLRGTVKELPLPMGNFKNIIQKAIASATIQITHSLSTKN